VSARTGAVRSLEDPLTTHESSAVSSRADVATATPDRFAKQLVSHLGHRVTFTADGAGSTAEIGGGVGTVLVGDGVLTLLAQAPDDDSLARVQDVLGRHLERFGQRHELVVTWFTTSGTPTSDTPTA
jgi:hypothetical protein